MGQVLVNCLTSGAAFITVTDLFLFYFISDAQIELLPLLKNEVGKLVFITSACGELDITVTFVWSVFVLPSVHLFVLPHLACLDLNFIMALQIVVNLDETDFIE